MHNKINMYVQYVQSQNINHFGKHLNLKSLKHESLRSLSDVSPKVRVCHDDSDYYSYTEIPIECISQGLSYTLVQVTIDKPSTQSFPSHLPRYIITRLSRLPLWESPARILLQSLG